MDNALQEIGFVMAIKIAPMEQMEGLILIAIVHQTNSNVQMDNASQQVHNVTDILTALIEVMKSVATVQSINSDVQMESTSQLVGGVMATLSAMIKVTKLIAIALHTK